MGYIKQVGKESSANYDNIYKKQFWPILIRKVYQTLHVFGKTKVDFNWRILLLTQTPRVLFNFGSLKIFSKFTNCTKLVINIFIYSYALLFVNRH